MSGPDGTPDKPEEKPARTAGKRRAVPERASRASGGVPVPRPAARPASRPPTVTPFPVLPPSERPAARPARRRAEPPTLPPGFDPQTDPYGFPAIPSAHAPRHAAPRPGVDRFAPPPPPEEVAAAAVAPAPVEVPAPPPVEAPPVPEPVAVAPVVTEPEPAPAPAEVARVRQRPQPAPLRIRRRGGFRKKDEAEAPDPVATPDVEPVETTATVAPPEPEAPVLTPDVEPVETTADVAPPETDDLAPEVPVAAPVERRVLRPVRTARAPAARPRDAVPPARTIPNPAAERLAKERRTEPVAATVPDTGPADLDWWVIALIVGAIAVASVKLFDGFPHVLRDIGAVIVSSSLAYGLAIRTGGRQYWALGLAAALGIAAVGSHDHVLMAGAAVGTGVVAATLGVMITTPAATYPLAIREAAIATVLAALGALGVDGYAPGKNPDINLDRFGYVVLGLALAGAFALVYRLGAGLHGLGRRGYVVAGGAVLMLVLALAYSEAIAHYGSRDIVSTGDDFRAAVRHHLGAVPHPIVAVLGYPALIWGVFMRARRRQGWWVCAFGVAATAPTATRLVSADTGVESVVLGSIYSVLIAIVVGYLLIRIEQAFSGNRGRRSRRDEEAVAHRPEPRRTAPLH